MTQDATLSPKGDFRFWHRLRVRWAEVDMQKIVFNAHYQNYFDTALTDYWRSLALPYEEAMKALGGEPYMKKASIEYHRSARCDDLLDVALKCERIGNSSMLFKGAIYRGHDLLVNAELTYVFADAVSQRPRPVPSALRQLLEGFESGQPVLSIKTGSWTALEEDAMDVRIEVFVDEQGIPIENEQDEHDFTALHAVAFNSLGQPVATGRLLQGEAGQGKIGRMAVKRELRGAGQGAAVLKALRLLARQRGDRELMLNAQCSAQTFYERQGFTPRGQVFSEEGLPHIEMFAPV